MLNLHRKKITLVALFLLLGLSTTSLYAQIRGTYNFLDFAAKPYYFGITLSYNTSTYRIKLADNIINNDSLRVANGIYGAGFNLGIVTNLKIGQHFDFRFLPTLSFVDRSVRYNTITNRQIDKRVESVYAEFPFQLRYKSDPYKDLRLYVLGGVKYAFDVASRSRSRQAIDLIQVAPNDFSVEFGVGCQFFFPYFVFSPEIKITHGIGNLLLYSENLEYSNVIDRLFSRTFTISFHFEG